VKAPGIWGKKTAIESTIAGGGQTTIFPTVDGSEIRSTHQLRLGEYPIYSQGFGTFQVVVWDF